MEGVSAESNALFVAFRRLVYNFSEQVSKEEQKTIIYIRLYKLKERYKDATMLEVLSKLEADGVFGPSNPEGLLEIAKDIKRQDLASEVKHFIKKRSKPETKGGLSSLSAALSKKIHPSPTGSPSHYVEDEVSEEDLQLKATTEVTLAQATVLMQQIEKLERAVAGGKAQRQRAKEAISEAGQTAAALADRLKKAQIELGLDGTYEMAASVGPAATVQAEEIGVVSHPISVGISSQYALQPQLRQLACIPEQSTEFDKKSKEKPKVEIIEEEEEDDYEKMQSYAVKEETIKAWRMSHLSNASSYGSFTPPSLPSRRSEHFGSYPSSMPQMPSIRPRSELHVPHAPGSPHNLQVPTSKGGGGKRNNVVPSTQTTDSHAPWARSHVSTINTNSSGSVHGNTTTTQTTHSTQVVHKPPQRLTTQQGSSAAASSHAAQMIQQTSKATVGGDNDKDSILKRVTQPSPSPPLPPKSKAAISPVNRSPVTSRKQDSPTLPKKMNHISGSSIDGTAKPAHPFAGIKSSSSKEAMESTQKVEESGKVNLVKARLERLERKASTLKPSLPQKPRPVITPRKKISGSWTLDHNSSLQREQSKKKQSTTTLPHFSSSSSISSLKQSQSSKARQNSSSSEDDAYILLHPSGASASTIYTGDSGFEDVRPLQRLDQEVVDDGGSSEPEIPTHPGVYTSLLEKRSAIPDQDGYTSVNYN